MEVVKPEIGRGGIGRSHDEILEHDCALGIIERRGSEVGPDNGRERCVAPTVAEVQLVGCEVAHGPREADGGAVGPSQLALELGLYVRIIDAQAASQQVGREPGAQLDVAIAVVTVVQS